MNNNRIVILSHDKATQGGVCMNQINGKLFMPERSIHGNKLFEVSDYGKNELGITPKHLYEISNDVIKIGDYFINLSNLNDPNNNICKCDTKECELNAKSYKSWKKVVRSTNKNIGLDLISNNEIKEYVKLFN